MIPFGLFSSTPSPTTATMDVSTSEIANAFANFFVVTQWPVVTTVICGYLVLLLSTAKPGTGQG